MGVMAPEYETLFDEKEKDPKPVLEDLPAMQRLSFMQRFAYGFGGTGIYANNIIISFFLNPFLLEVAGISPFAAGNLMLVGNVWDAISDPIIGWLSDRTPFPRRMVIIISCFSKECMSLILSLFSLGLLLLQCLLFIST
jgi:predicted MFS family arabinose efflux permease